jgi:hypothetical protein
MAVPCPVCKAELRSAKSHGDRYFFECLRCGPYSLSGTVNADFQWYLSRGEDVAAKLSYALYRMTKREQWAMLTSNLMENIIRNTELPRPLEQLDNLILWLGEKQPTMGTAVAMADDAIAATGAIDSISVGFLTSEAVEGGLISGIVKQVLSGEYVIPSIQLTLKGWQRFEELQHGKASGRHAFMAMPFGNSDLDKIVEEHFKPAVKATGFDLKRLDDGQPAGLIDDRLRVEIRQSRFLIADLTHENRGAYWEAGYAEGLGKPVIYTCRKDVFDDKARGTHFDTNHHLTVVWEADKLSEAIEKLKATIRATLPEEAKLDG